MTPQEKARNLIDKFRSPLLEEPWRQCIAESCALICVEQILEVLKNPRDQNLVTPITIYWNEVYDAIEAF